MLLITLRILIGISGLLGVLAALAFLAVPEQAALRLGVVATGALGIATVRADFPALFGVCGLFALAAAWKNRRQLLTTPLLIVGIALCGRCISYIIMGGGTAAVPPMMVEAVTCLLYGAGCRRLASNERR